MGVCILDNCEEGRQELGRKDRREGGGIREPMAVATVCASCTEGSSLSNFMTLGGLANS